MTMVGNKENMLIGDTGSLHFISHNCVVGCCMFFSSTPTTYHMRDGESIEIIYH